MIGPYDGQIDHQSTQAAEEESNSPSTASSTNSILAKHIRNFHESNQLTKSSLKTGIHHPLFRLNSLNRRFSNEINETKYHRWKFMSSSKRKKHLNSTSQSNLIFPENSDLNGKLISNRQSNQDSQITNNHLLDEQKTSQKINLTISNQKLNDQSTIRISSVNKSIPTFQIQSSGDNSKSIDPFTLYQMYHQDDSKFRSEQESNFSSNLNELKSNFNGQFNERRSISHSFGNRYLNSNFFDDNSRSIDFVIVYDCLLDEYGRYFFNSNENVSISNKQASQDSKSNLNPIEEEEDKKNEEKDDQTKKLDKENDEISYKSDSTENSQAGNRLRKPQEMNAELRRLSANDLDLIEQLDNNQDEEIEYLNTKIIDSLNQKSPPNTLTKRSINNPSIINELLESNSNEEIESISSLFDAALKANSNDKQNLYLKLSSKQRYLAECCKRFEDNLIAEGLELEFTEAKFVNTDNRKIGFLKIHVPWPILCRYAELIKLKMPMKQIESNWRLIFDKDDPYAKEKFTLPYAKDKEYLFDIPADKRLFFSSAQKSQIVEFILKRKSFSSNLNDTSFGISKLLHEGGYIAAYPLHEGILDVELHPKKLDDDVQVENGERSINFKKENYLSPRIQLYKNWASLKCIFRKQPLDEIRNYYGVKVGLYFAFLGFYTSMLVPASIVGIFCFLYGVYTLDYDIPTKQICNKTFDHIPMCPLCNIKGCDFFYLSETCSYSKFSYIFDNPGSIFFTIFMSFWSTVYLEMWKRYSSRITWRWDLSAFDTFEEFPRPEYLARLTKTEKKKLNLITKLHEPYIPFFRKHLNLIVSSSIVLLLIIVALVSVISVIIYRVSVRAAIAQIEADYSSIFTSTTAAFINLFFILILNQVYSYVCIYLTELELPRTQSDYDSSLTFKLYILQFVNYYSSIFYIAFFKGRLMSHPGEMIDNNRFTSLTQEECGTGGCLLELSIQLAIIMIGKQFVGGVIEISVPWIQKILKYYRLKKNDKTQSLININQCEADFLLNQWTGVSLFYEYLEMILQFGFIAIFSACFSLGPVFALINNLLEIRLDAKKMITSMRRPVAQRVKNIGIWYRILDMIGKLSVISSALIIAFTTEFIPKLYHFSKYGTLNTYLNHSLSYFNADEIIKIGNKEKFFKHLPHQPHYCLYQGYRHPPNHIDKYEPTQTNWEILALKLAFIVIFENVIVSTTMLIRYLIPDIPRNLRQRMRQHAYLTNEVIMQQEILRARKQSKN